MLSELDLSRKNIACRFPESWVCKSDKQVQLESNGCVFRGQELLDNHEIDIEKECSCGRPNKAT
ncbi:MAG: hypothetical protein QM500_13990 [Methylococcales bacterium]